MKRFLIHVSTHWCREEDTFRAIAKEESDLYDTAEQLAYENFQTYSHEGDIAREFGYDPDEMEDNDWDNFWENVSESDYYDYYIEEFAESEADWEYYGGEIYEG